MENNQNTESIDNQPSGDSNPQATAPVAEAPQAAPAQPQAAASQPSQVVGAPHPPKAIIGMVFGICSFVLCGLGPISFVLGLLAVIWYGKGKKAYMANPTQYNKAGFTMAKVGNILGWIGMSLSFLYFIFYIFLIIEEM